jgi:ribosomal protein S18 acetylase RimI-like enzyme
MLVIRSATTDDAPAIAKVHVESWQHTYKGIIPQPYLDSLTVQRRTIGWIRLLERGNDLVTLVSEDDKGRIVGFAGGCPIRHRDDRFQAEITSLYVAPHAQRRGHGRRLFLATANRLHQMELKGLFVWVLAANPATAFYRAMGGEPVSEMTAEFAGTPLKEIGYGWTETPAYG